MASAKIFCMALVSTVLPITFASVRPTCLEQNYQYCVTLSGDFYYEPKRSECATVPPGARFPPLCLHGLNRFESLESCFERCVHAYQPEKSCFYTPTFYPCTRGDFHRHMWYFQDATCIPWDVPAGGCKKLSLTTRLFESSSECYGNCAGHRNDPCGPPEEGACGVQALRFSHFAALSGTGHNQSIFKCVTPTESFLLDHVCSADPNSFPTREDCTDECLKA